MTAQSVGERINIGILTAHHGHKTRRDISDPSAASAGKAQQVKVT
ncbi:hypothetical protein HNQ68_002275 [Pseudochrobactrum saccharolyticum]|uniref:Uncharacterized protein n=1 Tax=Pseudochrobactrum saccharolyticum TaxID=354352 RepID=A0A7W8AKV6_9HYPH|nr:hypothetical protein [Pseudochrobactrum saccharolyticum]MBB5091734.1 hypothetical protein [Pseudochrobactrum saccharolyticum]